MLNYIWAGLLAFALIFAVASDVRDTRHDTFANGRPLAVKIHYHGAPADSPHASVGISIDPTLYADHFHIHETIKDEYPATLMKGDAGYTLQIKSDASLPPRLAAMRDITDDKVLNAKVEIIAQPTNGEATASVTFGAVRFVKIRAISTAGMDMSKKAVTLALDLIGVLALWLGLMKIGEAAGLIDLMVKVIQPILRPLFPSVPKNHPAMGYIAINLAGNILGLGNATTAMGLKAMELQKLNPTDDTATDPMVMLLAIHTAAFQLVPPATVVAIMGFSALQVFVPMLLVGLIATVIAILATKLLGKLPMYRRTDPERLRGTAGNIGEVGGMNTHEVLDLVGLFIFPLLMVGLPIYGLCRRVPVYENFVEGAKEGFSTAIKIIPYLVAILFAIAMFRASGAMDYLEQGLRKPLSWIGMPPEVLEMAIVRPLTGSGSLAVLEDVTQRYGADSPLTKMAATIYGSTETTFYVLAVYFGAVNIRKTRHALPAGIIADVSSILLSCWIIRLFFGH